ncbi:MAG: DUF4430 domain-containing protein [Lachnospiraceae bacterium]|nr:DUF4430 domain-containing protein [Lachnospiraceae bacterium]
MKNRTKSIVAVTLVSALSAMLLVAGCGSKQESASSTETVETEVTETVETETTETDTTEAETTETEAASTEAAETEVTSEGTKDVTLTVVDNEGNSTSYEANTDAEYLSEVFDDIEDLTVEGYDDTYGFYITAVNGLTADYDADGAYWAIYVNGEYGMYGADTQPVTDGDAYELKYETAGN